MKPHIGHIEHSKTIKFVDDPAPKKGTGSWPRLLLKKESIFNDSNLYPGY
jgi:hypothetical protein